MLATDKRLDRLRSASSANQKEFSTPVFAAPNFAPPTSTAPQFKQSFDENISFELPESTHSISIQADQVKHWVEGNFEVLYLQGNVEIKQATLGATAGQAIVWIEIPKNNPIDSATTRHQVMVYLEDKVVVDLASQSFPNTTNERIRDQAWFGRLQTTGTINLGRQSEELTASKPLLFNRAKQARDKNQANRIQQTAFLQSFPVDPQGNSLTSDGQVWVEDSQFPTTSGFAQRPQTVINPSTGQLQTLPAGGFQTPQASQGTAQPFAPNFAPTPTTPAQSGGQLTQARFAF